MGYNARLIAAKRTLGLKLEATSGNAETLVAANYGIGAREISYSGSVGSYMRKLATGDFSRFTSVSGKQHGEVSFICDMNPGGAAGTFATPARWFEAMRACCMKQTAFTTTGIRIGTDATADTDTVTIEVCERQEGASPNQFVVKLAGCAGDWEIDAAAVGEPAKIKFTFKGFISSVGTRTFANILVPTSFDVQMPPAILSATIQLFGTTQYISKFSIKANNVVELFTDPSNASGYCYARVTDRGPIFEADPDLFVTTDSIDLYNKEITNTTGVLSIAFGSDLLLYAPAAQITESLKIAEREGHVIQSVKLELKRSSGNDEFKFLQGSES